MDEEEQLLASVATNERVALQLYDFFKHLTTLAVVTIGGVLGLMQSDRLALSPNAFLVVIATIGAAGGFSLLVNATSLTTALSSGAELPRVIRSARWVQLVAMGLYIFGVGIFVGAFSKAMGS